MTSAAASVPEERHLLCEKCGYTLSGLPTDSRCPECGAAIAESLPSLRHPSAWEVDPSPRSFLRTSAMILFHTARFYRTLATRAPVAPALRFALAHWAVSALALGCAAFAHAQLFFVLSPLGLAGRAALFAGFALLAFLMLWVTTRMAAVLTAWEAAYRGLRLPLPVVLRAMYFHAAHYVPVAVIAFLTTAGYLWWLSEALGRRYDSVYLYTLAGEVIVGGDLFHTYWIGMRNIMYANA